MAKALNCEQGPTPEPCGSCHSCLEIKAGNSVDLHEVDGASNRGIQEIRELKENIRFMPVSSRFKIIIIDEVHMLTTEAFNALLKTLEEPPEHVYFMFATTELHKVPVTILSRCQRYELKRVSHEDLYSHFASLAGKEGVTIDDASLNLIVREAGGSVRDGLSLLDQVFSYCGDTVTGDEVIEVLGLVSHQVIAELAEALLAGNLAAALSGLNDVYSYGMDIKRFINELLSWFRSLVVCSVSRQPQALLDLPADEFAVLEKTAAAHSAQSLSLMFHLLMEGLEKAVFSARPRFAVEMVFIQAVQAADVVPVTTLLKRLDDLLDGVPLPQVAVQIPAEPVPPKVEESAAARTTPPVVLPDKSEPVSRKAEKKKAVVKPPAAAPAAKPPVETPPLPPEPDEPVEPVIAAEKAPVRKKPEPGGEKKDIRKRWQGFIEYVADRKKWMAATLQRAASAHIEEGILIIEYEDSVDCRIIKSKDNLIPLTEFAMDFFQESLQIQFKVPHCSGCDTDPDSGAALQKERQVLANDSLVLTACEVFNGQVGDIRVGPRFRQPLTVENKDT
jgi:DNA polymerase-3 subunit gamma/tau